MAGSLNVNDLIIRRSDRSGCADLSVTIHEFPANAPSSFTPARDAYTFWYRPRREKGDTWVTVPELGLSHHHISRNHVLVTPPSVPHRGEWERADGIVVNFGFSPRLFNAWQPDFADELSLEQLASKAQMSRSHFALTFRQFTGYTPHQYLLLVRLNKRADSSPKVIERPRLPRSLRQPVFVIRRTSTGIFGASSAQRLRLFDPGINF